MKIEQREALGDQGNSIPAEGLEHRYAAAIYEYGGIPLEELSPEVKEKIAESAKAELERGSHMVLNSTLKDSVIEIEWVPMIAEQLNEDINL